MTETWMTGGWIAGAAVGLYFFWVLARKVVKWGFFVLYFLVGSCITWALNPLAPAALPVGVGVAFAYSVISIQRRILKVVVGAALLGALGFVLPNLIDFGKKEMKNESKSLPSSTRPKKV